MRAGPGAARHGASHAAAAWNFRATSIPRTL